MRYLFTSGQSKQLDDHAINNIGFPGLVLMEKAAMTLVSVLIERESRDSGILIVCGSGNNGGDGLAAARMLHQHGFRTAVVLVGDPEKMTPDARKQLALAAACDVPVQPEETVGSPFYSVLVDSLFGVGLSRDIGGVYEKVIQDINFSGKKIYAVDIPSGINGDDGRVMNVAVKADVTVTFGVNKLGLVLYPGCQYAGEIIIGDIGYPRTSYEAVENPVFYFEPDDLPAILPERAPDGHKGSFGHVAVIGGSSKMSGAALLSAKAAYASGAGLVMICSARENRDLLLAGCPEALFEAYDEEEGEPDFLALERVLSFADTVVLGPGLGREEKAKKITAYVLKNCDKPMILDGDALVLCSREELKGRNSIILTPHPKEFSVLSHQKISYIKEHLGEAVREFAADTGCILVGKDARTIVGDGSRQYVNVSGNSGMGTGGSGDVLTGIIAGFAAQGKPLFEAAATGVYVHGLAGDYYTETYSPYSMTASALIDSLKNIL
ncbi:MAG: NAD(P)H-hydrate dehydratase [Eubacterium sp.]|nr:NAD(P)H-hydrate dehydratase [Eubacterium sp.]